MKKNEIKEIFIIVMAAQMAQIVKLRYQIWLIDQLYITLGLQTHVYMQYVHK